MGLGERTQREILGQFEAWETALDQVFRREDLLREFFGQGFSGIILTGCGTSYCLALTAAFLFRALARARAWALPASELLLFPRVHLSGEKKPLLIPISRSGETSELLRAIEGFRKISVGKVLAVTCRGESPLSGKADLVLWAEGAEDLSVVQTRSFTTMLLMLLAVACLIEGKAGYHEQLLSLPEYGREMLRRHRAEIGEIAVREGIEKFIYLGSGHNYGLACAAMLNMKEATLSDTEAYHFLELRHGPLAIIDRGTLVIGFLSGTPLEVEVLREARELGAAVLALGEQVVPVADLTVQVPFGLTGYMESILYMPLLQWMSLQRAIRKGIDPDAPPHLSRVVRLQDVQADSPPDRRR